MTRQGKSNFLLYLHDGERFVKRFLHKIPPSHLRHYLTRFDDNCGATAAPSSGCLSAAERYGCCGTATQARGLSLGGRVVLTKAQTPG